MYIYEYTYMYVCVPLRLHNETKKKRIGRRVAKVPTPKPAAGAQNREHIRKKAEPRGAVDKNYVFPSHTKCEFSKKNLQCLERNALEKIF